MRRRISIRLLLLALMVLPAAYVAGAFSSLRNTPAVSFKNVIGSAASGGNAAADSADIARIPDKRPALAPTGTSKPAPLPSAYTPLRESITDLQARANGGDAAAASRLYRDLARCTYAGDVIRANTASTEEILAYPTESLAALDADVRKHMLDDAERKTENSTYLKTLCAGVDADMLSLLATATLHAAQLGDAYARDCYVNRGPLANPRDMIANPDSLSIYRRESPALIESALAAGDWRMVDMLQYAYSPGAVAMLAGLVDQDNVQHYRYLKLFRLGAADKDTQRLDRRLAYAADTLTAGQRAEADAWAQATFEKNFRGTSTEAARPSWNACEIPAE